jgi:thiol-activated cytolysin
MKNKLKRLSKVLMFAIMLTVITVFAPSCSKDDNTEDYLKSVQFENNPSGEISSWETGTTVLDPITGQILKEYAVTYEKSTQFNEVDLIKNDGIGRNLLYPANILRGSSFMQGQYDPLVLTNSFKPVTVFFEIKGVDRSPIRKENIYPSDSAINKTITDLLNQNGYSIPSSYIMMNYKYECDSVSTSKSFKKIINIHSNADVLNIVKSQFYYEDSQSINSDKKYVLVKLKQYVYSVGIEHFNKWVEGELLASQCGEYEPVYISSVNYGKVAYLLIQTNATTAETKKMVNASIDFLVGGIGGSANVAYSNEFKRLFNEGKIKVSVLGGPASVITGYDSFVNHIKDISFQYVTSRPISFTVRRLKDNTQVEIVNYYTDIIKEYRP